MTTTPREALIAKPLPKRCECGGEMAYEIDFGRVFSWCKSCTPVVKVKLP